MNKNINLTENWWVSIRIWILKLQAKETSWSLPLCLMSTMCLIWETLLDACCQLTYTKDSADWWGITPFRFQEQTNRELPPRLKLSRRSSRTKKYARSSGKSMMLFKDTSKLISVTSVKPLLLNKLKLLMKYSHLCIRMDILNLKPWVNWSVSTATDSWRTGTAQVTVRSADSKAPKETNATHVETCTTPLNWKTLNVQFASRLPLCVNLTMFL